MRLTPSTLTALVLSTLLGSGLSAAAEPDGQAPQQHRRGPPPAAFEVCKDKAEGTACTFQGYRGEVSGTCRMGPESASVCAPAHLGMRDGQWRRRPPPAAFAACEGRTEGAACTFESPRGELSGTCRAKPDAALVCLPQPPPAP